jgi:tetratricopeptide (TPR) repeat protein
MDLSEIERDMARIAEHLQRGKGLFENQRYEDALKELNQALKLINEGHPPDHPDRIDCLNLLGDTDIALQRPGDALLCFKELIELSEEFQMPGIERPSVMLKLAKLTAKTGDDEQSEMWFQRAIEESLSNLTDGHPLITVALESYSEFLDKSPSTKDKAFQLKTRARENRTRFKSNKSISEERLDKLQSSDRKSKGSETPAALRRSPRNYLKQKQAIIDKPGKSLASLLAFTTLAIVIILTFGRVLRIFANDFSQAIRPSKSLPSSHAAVIASYRSIDDYIGLIVYSNHCAELKRGNKTKSVIYSDSKENVLAVLAPMTARFVKNRDFIVDDAGNKLYGLNSPELKVASNMQSIAAAAEEYYRFSGEYPDEEKKLASVVSQIRNPLNAGFEAVHFVYLGREKLWSQELADYTPTSEEFIAKNGKSQDMKDLIPCCTYYYFHLCGTAELGIKVKIAYIVGTDRDGQPLINSSNRDVYEFKLKNGLNVKP